MLVQLESAVEVTSSGLLINMYVIGAPDEFKRAVFDHMAEMAENLGLEYDIEADNIWVQTDDPDVGLRVVDKFFELGREQANEHNKRLEQLEDRARELKLARVERLLLLEDRCIRP